MFPCFIQMAPSIHWPASGDLYQNIAPETDWFSTHIGPRAGDPQVEREVNRDVASYGKQIGKLIELCLLLAEQSGSKEILESEVLRDIRELDREVRAVKEKRRGGIREEARSVLARLRDSDREGYDRVMEEFSR